MRVSFPAVLLLAAACGGARPPAAADAPPAPRGPDNLEVLYSAVVAGPEDDALEALAVIVDGVEIGRTPPAVRARESRWRGRAAAGNRLLRLERWTAERIGPWRRAEHQPEERFVRVEPGMRTTVRIRYHGRQRRYAVETTRRLETEYAPALETRPQKESR